MRKLSRLIILLLILAAAGLTYRAALAQQGEYNLYFPLVAAEPQSAPTATRTPVPTRTITPSPTPMVTPLPPEIFSTSYYMNTVNPAKFYDLGCAQGQRDLALPGAQDSVVILDFGQAAGENGQYGVWLFNVITFQPTANLIPAIQEFGRGYWVCSGADRQSKVTVGIGTSNYGSWFRNTTNSYANARNHGAAWAQMVRQVNEYLAAGGYAGQVLVVGAIDMELSWSGPLPARAWVEGFNANDQEKYRYYNFGDCAGCPSIYHPGWSPTNGWTLWDVWYTSWGAQPAWPLPLIYADDGINAYQWQWLSRYSVINYNSKILFKGPMTQYQACQQVGGCEAIHLDNTPLEGWSQLWEALNSDSRTSQDSLPWSTDIKYYYR